MRAMGPNTRVSQSTSTGMFIVISSSSRLSDPHAAPPPGSGRTAAHHRTSSPGPLPTSLRTRPRHRIRAAPLGKGPRMTLTRRPPEPTPRLAFREMTPDDLDDMAALLGDSDVMRY